MSRTKFRSLGVAATIVIVALSAIVAYEVAPFRLRTDAYSTIVARKPGLGPICSITWSDMIPPCSFRISLVLSTLGLSRRAEANYVFFPIYAQYASEEDLIARTKPTGCSYRTVVHVGNDDSARAFDDGSDYFRAIASRPTQADRLWSDVRLGARVMLCKIVYRGLDYARFDLNSGRVLAVKLWSAGA